MMGACSSSRMGRLDNSACYYCSCPWGPNTRCHILDYNLIPFLWYCLAYGFCLMLNNYSHFWQLHSLYKFAYTFGCRDWRRAITIIRLLFTLPLAFLGLEQFQWIFYLFNICIAIVWATPEGHVGWELKSITSAHVRFTLIEIYYKSNSLAKLELCHINIS